MKCRRKAMCFLKMSMILISIISCMLNANASLAAAEREHLTLSAGAGNPGGPFYSLTSAMSEIIMSKLDYITMAPKPSASAAVPEAIQQGELMLGICQTAAAADAIAGKVPYSEPSDKVMQMLVFRDMPLHVILRAEAGIKSMEDLKGKSVIPLNRGSAGEKSCNEWLQIYKMTYDDFGQAHFITGTDGISIMKNRQADALFIANTPPLSYVTDLATAQKVDLLDFPADKIAEYCKTYVGYYPCVIPVGTYKEITHDIHTVGAINIFAVSAALDENIVYEMTKAVVENRTKLGDVLSNLKGITPEQLGKTTIIPMHPGALRYFKEIGVVK